MTNQTPNSKIAEILETMDGYLSGCCEECARPAIEAATQLQQLMIEARLNETKKALHQSWRDDYVVKYLDYRIKDLQAQLNKEVE